MTPFVTDLQQILFELSGIGPDDTRLLFEMTKPVKLAANEVYIPEGDKSKKLAFIEQGIIRAYAVKENGAEATFFLRWEGHFFASHDTIIQHRPSRFIFRALENTSLREIDYDMLEAVLRKHTEYEPLRNFVLMKMLSDSLETLASFVMLSPEERYLRLVASKRDIVNRVPGKYIASMLGITPVSLSRIRKRIHTKGH